MCIRISKTPTGTTSFLADDRLVISASHDKTAKIWDASKAIEIATLDGHKGPIVTLALSPDGKLMASGGTTGSIDLWRLD